MAVIVNSRRTGDGAEASKARDLRVILEQEGEWTTLYGEGSASLDSTATNTTIIGTPVASVGGRTFAQPYIGRCMYVQDIWIDCSRAGYFQIGNAADTNNIYEAFNTRIAMTANRSARIPVNNFFQFRRSASPNMVLSVRNFRETFATENVRGSIMVHGWTMTDDLNFYADETLMVVGDSICYGDGWGPTKSEEMYTHLVRDYLRGLGADVRLLSYAKPGLTTSMVNTDMVRGRYDYVKPTICLYALGTNDAVAAAGGFVDTYSTNMLAFWSRLKLHAPNCRMVVVPPPPLNDNTQETNAALIRTRAASDVAAVNSPNLIVVSGMGSSFDRTNTSFYRDPGVDGIHPGTTGHAAISTTITATLASNNVRP